MSMSMSILLLCSAMAIFLVTSCVGLPPAPAPRALHGGGGHNHNNLLPSPHPSLSYHAGPLLAAPSPIRIYFIFCGTFSAHQIAILADFASSFSGPSASGAAPPTVATWWRTATLYRDKGGAAVSAEVVAAEASAKVEAPAEGSVLKRSEVGRMVEEVVAEKGELPVDGEGLYVVLTGSEVAVEGFCMSECGFHDVVHMDIDGVATQLAFAWVGNPAVQCLGFCAWPFAGAEYGPPPTSSEILRPPNGDAAVDGMIISLATVLAGAATNPRKSGFYEGDPEAPLEAVSACAGMYGSGGLPGQVGELLLDGKTGVKYNANGANGRRFLLPAMWSPASERCETLPPPPTRR